MKVGRECVADSTPLEVYVVSLGIVVDSESTISLFLFTFL